MTRLLLSLLFLVLSFTASKGQSARLIVSSPVRGAVYQQDGGGGANIFVQGSYNSLSLWLNNGTVTVSATLTPLNLTDGNPKTGGSTISVPLTVSKGVFYGSARVAKGWYRIDIRVNKTGSLAATYNSKVGVGEVFIICGQSNAQGFRSDLFSDVVAQPSPTMDAVRVQPDIFGSDFLGASNTSQLYDVRYMANFPGYGRKKPVVGVLNSPKDNLSSAIGPLGGSLWLWAALGEKIASAKQVPVAFYNAAFGGTTITNWWDSRDPNVGSLGKILDLNDPNQKGSNRFAAGIPYGFLRNTLKFYGSLFGVRAILWHQGETDTKTLREPLEWADFQANLNSPVEIRRLVDANDYRNKLSDLITASRSGDRGLGDDVSWVVGKTSFIENNFDQYSLVVRQGQEALITAGISKVFRGPDTDPTPNLQTSGVPVPQRRTGPSEPTHFNKEGLATAAQLWYDKLGSLLDDGSSATPITPFQLGTEPKTLEAI